MAVIGTTPDDSYIIVEETTLTLLQAAVLALYPVYQAWGGVSQTAAGYAQTMTKKKFN